MKGIVSEIFILLGATPADFIIITMGTGVTLFVLFLFRKITAISKKYQILNTNHLALWVMISPDAVKWHHSGEYHIDIKALADLAKASNSRTSNDD